MQYLMHWIAVLEGVLGAWVIRFRWLAILCSVAIVFIASLGFSDVRFSTGYRLMFDPSSEKIHAFDALEAEFTAVENALFLIEARDGNAFDPKVLEVAVQLTEAAWQLPYVQRVDSLTNYQHTTADGDDLTVSDLVFEPLTASQSSLDNIKHIALTEPALIGQMAAADGSLIAVNAVFSLPDEEDVDGIVEEHISVAAYALKHQFEQANPHVRIYVTGRVVMDYAFYDVGMSDSASIIPLSIALMLIILLVLSRSVTATLLTVVVVLGSLITALGITAHLGLPFHSGNGSAPPVIVTIASASCVHLLMSFLQSRRKLGNTHEAVIEAMRVNLQPITLTSISTAIGFLSILLSDVPVFRVLSVMVSLGILASLFFVLFLLPALLSFMPNLDTEKSHPANGIVDQSMAALGRFVVTYRRSLWLAMLAFIVVCVAAIPKNELNDNFISYFGKELKFRVASDVSSEKLSGLYRIQYGLNSGKKGGVNNPEFLAEVEQLSNWLNTQPEVKHVSTITDTYKRLNMNLHGDAPAHYTLPQNRDEAAQYLLLYEMSLPYGLDLANQINIDKSKTRLVVSVDSLSSNGLIAFDTRVTNWANENTQYLQGIEGMGPSVLFAYVSRSNGRSMMLTTGVALMGISGLLILMLGSLRIGFISLVPNLIPAAIGFGVWGFIDGEINIILALVMTMTLGIVVDDTVHFLAKYQRARKELNMNANDAVIYSFKTVGQSLITTSLMLAGGFFIMAMSSFTLNSTLGLLTGIIILAALIADFFFLPPLLMFLDRDKVAKERKPVVEAG